MSRERVEATRRIFDGWARGDFTAAAATFDPNVVLVIRSNFPEPGVYLGPDRIARYTRGLLSGWSEYTIEAEDFVDAGDSVLVQVKQHGAGRTSGLTAELRFFQVFTWRGESIIRIESIGDRAEALASVGLSE